MARNFNLCQWFGNKVMALVHLFLPCTSFQQWGSFVSEWKLASPLTPGAGQDSGAHLKSSLIDQTFVLAFQDDYWLFTILLNKVDFSLFFS